MDCFCEEYYSLQQDYNTIIVVSLLVCDTLYKRAWADIEYRIAEKIGWELNLVVW